MTYYRNAVRSSILPPNLVRQKAMSAKLSGSCKDVLYATRSKPACRRARQSLLQTSEETEMVMVDATEIMAEHLKKATHCYSGKRRHTLKMQVVGRVKKSAQGTVCLCNEAVMDLAVRRRIYKSEVQQHQKTFISDTAKNQPQTLQETTNERLSPSYQPSGNGIMVQRAGGADIIKMRRRADAQQVHHLARTEAQQRRQHLQRGPAGCVTSKKAKPATARTNLTTRLFTNRGQTSVFATATGRRSRSSTPAPRRRCTRDSYATIYRGIYAGRFNDLTGESGKQRLRYRGKRQLLLSKGELTNDNFLPDTSCRSARQRRRHGRIGDWLTLSLVWLVRCW